MGGQASHKEPNTQTCRLWFWQKDMEQPQLTQHTNVSPLVLTGHGAATTNPTHKRVTSGSDWRTWSSHNQPNTQTCHLWFWQDMEQPQPTLHTNVSPLVLTEGHGTATKNPTHQRVTSGSDWKTWSSHNQPNTPTCHLWFWLKDMEQPQPTQQTHLSPLLLTEGHGAATTQQTHLSPLLLTEGHGAASAHATKAVFTSGQNGTT